jgi:DNA-binding transcriptional LysR family regulator
MDRIDAMRLFSRIAERGSFAQAARDLQIPRPTATLAVQRMEQELGTRLLERTTRTVRLTRDGRIYLERISHLLADLDETENLFRTRAPKGPLRVDLQGTIARFHVMPALPDFIACYPEIELYLSETDRMVNLVSEGVDCVVRAGELADSSLTGRQLTAFECLTYASREYLDRNGIPQSLDDLKRHVMVGYAGSATGQPSPLEFCTPDGLQEIMLPCSILVRGAEVYAAAAVAGLGLVQTPRYRIVDALEKGDLMEVLPNCPPPPIPIWALYPENRHISARVRVFIDWLVELFKSKDL